MREQEISRCARGAIDLSCDGGRRTQPRGNCPTAEDVVRGNAEFLRMSVLEATGTRLAITTRRRMKRRSIEVLRRGVDPEIQTPH